MPSKKKIEDELTLYFPDDFDNAGEKEYYDIMRKRTECMLDAVINGEDEKKKERIEHLTDELVCFTKPKTFTGRDSVEIIYDRKYEDMCLLMSQQLYANPKKYTVMEYYNAYRFIKDSMKRQKKRFKARQAQF